MKKQLLAILLIASVIFAFCGCKDGSITASTFSNIVSNVETSSFSSNPETTSYLSSLDSSSTIPTSSFISSSTKIKRSVDAEAHPSVIPIGETLILGAIVKPNDPNKHLAKGTWSISDESIVEFVYNEKGKSYHNKLNSCIIKALKPGTVTMTINVTSKEGNCSDTCTVTVVKPEDLKRSVSFNDIGKDIPTVHVGEKDWIGISYSYHFFSIKDEEYKIEFKVSDETKVQVSYTERTLQERKDFGDEVFVYGLSPGKVTLTVTVYVGEKAITDTCRIRVEESRNNISATTSYPASSS